MTGAASAIARRAFVDARVRTISFAFLFAAASYANVVGYGSAYPTVASRVAFARSLGGNDAVRLFYGTPYDLLTVGGYAAWRVGGLLSIFAAVWALLGAVRAMRAEEDAGRAELTMTGVVARRGVFLASLCAIAAGAVILWLAAALGLVAGGLPLGGSAYLALAIVAVVPVFAGVGALASQLAPTRRIAIELSSAVLLLAFLVRVVADTSKGLGWLRWATPLGWSEELRAFTGPRPAVLLLPLASAAALLVAAVAIAAGRDIGSGLLPTRDSAPPNPRLLSSPTLQTLREERTSLIAWLLGSGFFAFVIGVISKSISSAGLSPGIQHQLHKLVGISVVTPAGYIGFSFLFFVLAISLFACAQLAAVHGAESEQQLETLFALPVARGRWLAGRLVLATSGAVAIALVAGALAWAGAVTQHAEVSLRQMIEAGANCLPVALLFLGLGALAYATLPRASTSITYGLVTVAFVWDLFGGVLGAPRWLLDLSPFQHVGFVPAQAFRAGAAGVMLAIALASVRGAVWLFRRRDLTGP